MSYNIDREREVTWLSASADAQIFYGENEQGTTAYVFDEQYGFINLHSKELLFEYHALDKNKDVLGIDKTEMGV